MFCIDDEVRSLIHQGADMQALTAAARRGGMRSMREDGERWVRDGVTAPEEIIRVTRDA
ncbi:proteinral secretion pathway protein GspE [Pseudomonas syringae pv. coriandricola]|nr:proteinral secretion pathway protein GspE [Pseudomonas syringae pv. coriandricola]